jgi:predicted kinase
MLYIMTGIPASGKSTLCKQIFSGNPHVKIVSRDQIRLSVLDENDDYFGKENAVYSKFVDTIAEALDSGFDVVADATHLNHNSRKKLINEVYERKFITEPIDVTFINCHVGLKVALERNSHREGRAKVPDSAIKEMAYRYKCFEYGEDYGHCNIKGVWDNW